MKKLLLPLFLLLFSVAFHLSAQSGQAPKFDWGRLLFDDTAEAEMDWFDVGPQGDMLFVGGYYGNSFSIGSSVGLSQPVGSDGAVFVAAIGKDGTSKWLRQIFSKQNTSLYNDGYFFIGGAPDGSVYVYGDFLAPRVFFGNDFTLDKECTEDECQEAFLAKYAANGDFLWARRISTDEGEVYVGSIAVGQSGEVVVSGEAFGSELSFGNGQTASFGLGAGAYLARYDANGDCQWARAVEGADFYFGEAVHIANNGDILCSVSLSESVDFGDGVQLVPVGTGGDNFGFVRFGPTGIPQRAVAFYSPSSGGITSLRTDPNSNGSVYVLGYADEGLEAYGTALLPIDPAATYQFVLKTDPQAGTVEWVKSVDDIAENADINWLDVTPSGKVLVSGAAYEDINFAGAPLAAGGCSNNFLVQLSGNGSLDWGRTVGSSESCEDGMAIWADAQHNLYVLGLFAPPSTAADGFSIETDPLATDEAWYIGRLPAGSVPVWEPVGMAAALPLSPNPCVGQFVAQLFEAALLTVSTADGRVVFQQDFHAAGPQRVALPADVAPGIYLVRAQGAAGVASGKIVLSR